MLRYIALALLIPYSAGASVTVGNLDKSCNTKVLVYSRAGGIVGSKIDQYCAGYLQASLEFMERGTICKNELDSDPNYLLSVFRKYIETKKVKSSEMAAATLRDALTRAFDCR
jgi:hypothetical protein